MSDLLGSLNQAQTVVDDYTDSDDTPDNSPSISPKNTLSKTSIHDDIEEKEETEVIEETVINNIEIVIDDISGN